MHYIKFVISCIFISQSLLLAEEFTIATYNAGSLSEHYDYLRAVAMQKVMQERYNVEPENMALNDAIQQTALKKLFAKTPQEKLEAENEWNQKGYQQLSEKLTSTPTENQSPNQQWHEQLEQTITSYKIRPISIHDEEVSQMLEEYLNEITFGKTGERNNIIEEARAKMAKRIFAHQLKYDIICLQEADYLNASMFPEHYEVIFSDNSHSINGILWNKKRFTLVETLGSIVGRGFAVKLEDNVSGKILLVASGHLTGCNPYRVDMSNDGKKDSSAGDNELATIIDLFNTTEADFKIIGMDSNVTALHPRLRILKEANYHLDYENFFEPTCANPHQVLNTRIDWIAVQKGRSEITSIVNIPVLGVGLNNMQTNISDHKPVAAKISF